MWSKKIENQLHTGYRILPQYICLNLRSYITFYNFQRPSILKVTPMPIPVSGVPTGSYMWLFGLCPMGQGQEVVSPLCTVSL